MPGDLVVVSFVGLANNVVVKKSSALPSHALPRAFMENGRVDEVSKIPFFVVPQVAPLTDLVFILDQTESHFVRVSLFEVRPLAPVSYTHLTLPTTPYV